ncbi:aminopeptidase N [Propionibacteriaceae bacterium G1746]|uniref:aminopeptidase N n=1 Tax=Aestuariimicrobium sp. G57 TaxID=3418485 RepID=UPI003C177909
MTNITRDEALRRSTIVRSHSYHVTLDLSGLGLEDAEHFVSSTTARFTTSTGEPTHIDLIADEVREVVLDGTPLDPTAFTGTRYPFTAEPGDHELTITAVTRYSHTGEGLHRFVDPADDRVYLYTQFEPADARRVFANFDQPNQKAQFALRVIAPKHWVVVSNSAAVEPEPFGNEADNLGRWTFAPTPPISTYITAVVAGEYHVVQHTINGTEGPVPASVLCRQSVKQHLDDERIITTTQRGFDVFEADFGMAYPFGTYDQAFVPEYNAGAMENAGLVTIRDEYLFRSRVTAAAYEGRDNTILHELAHMWFGDLVTMKWWDDLWLNESFAEWASHYAQSRIVAQYGGVDPWVSFANARKGWAYAQDQLPTTHPIVADMVDLRAVEQNFDGITYAKGASALKQLVSIVGQDTFLEGVRAYFRDHAWGNTELSDLLGALEKASGRDLSWFSGEWLEKAGVNTLRADFDVDGAGNFTRFDVVQTAHPDWPTLRTHTLAVGLFDLVEGTLTRRESLPVEISGERTPIAVLVGQPRADLVLLNDQDLSYAKVRLDEHSLTTAVSSIDTLDDALARALLWGAAWDMTRDAEMTSSDYVNLVVRGVGAETDLTAVQTLTRQANLAASAYTDPSLREQVRADLVPGLALQLKNAEPGSDHQLAFANALIAAVSSPAGVDLLRALLSGDEVPEGLDVDTDMRWRILVALARQGATTTDEIAAEAERDKTISGAEQAAGVRAALKDADTKAEAWRLATADPAVPNGTHRAVCANFLQFDQVDLLAPYQQRYLEVAEAISDGRDGWADRGHAAVDAVLTLLYPIDADQAWVERTDEWLAAGERSDQVRRTITERRDALVRALKCQQASLA